MPIRLGLVGQRSGVFTRRCMGKKLPIGRIFTAVAVFVGGAGLVFFSVLIGFLGWNAWSGNRQWDALSKELRSKGEKLTLTEFIPPAVPDEENFFGDPLWHELLLEKPSQPLLFDQLNPPVSKEEITRLRSSVVGKWKESNKRNSVAISILSDRAHHHENAESVLTLLEPADPLLERLGDLASRPYAQFPFDYAQVPILKTPHLMPMLTVGQILYTRSVSQLETGCPSQAFYDTQQLFHLANKMRDEPMFVCLLVRVTLVILGLESLQKGLEKHVWDGAQLATLDHELRGFDLLPEVAMTARRERGSFNQFYNDQLAEAPTSKKAQVAFFRRDQATFNRLTQEWIEHLDMLNESGFRQKVGMEEKVQAIRSGWTRYFHLFTLLALPATESIEDKALNTQSRIFMARIACAIERYRLAEGSLPEHLDELVPEFLPALPRDIIAHEAFRYRRVGDDKYVLYSVAMNLVDDDGKTDANEDWVWGVPTKKLPAK